MEMMLMSAWRSCFSAHGASIERHINWMKHLSELTNRESSTSSVYIYIGNFCTGQSQERWKAFLKLSRDPPRITPEMKTLSECWIQHLRLDILDCDGDMYNCTTMFKIITSQSLYPWNSFNRLMLTHAIVNCGLLSVQKCVVQYPICSMVLEYLPTFGWFLGQMLVNIPYMEQVCGQPIDPVTEGTVDVLLHFADGHTILGKRHLPRELSGDQQKHLPERNGQSTALAVTLGAFMVIWWVLMLFDGRGSSKLPFQMDLKLWSLVGAQRSTKNGLASDMVKFTGANYTNWWFHNPWKY